MKYKEYIKKIIRIIEDDDNIDVIKLDKSWRKSKSNCYALNQTISLGTKGPSYLVLAALAHEWGHCHSIRTGRGLPMRLSFYYKLGVIFNKKHADAILREEKRAWKFGFKLLHDNGIYVSDDMKYAGKVLTESHIKPLNSFRKKFAGRL